jgi:hypothetical protein
MRNVRETRIEVRESAAALKETLPSKVNLCVVMKLLHITSWSLISPSLCYFVHISVFTLKRFRIFSLYVITRFGLTGHHHVYETLD